MNILHTPIKDEDLKGFHIGDMAYVSGNIFCGRDIVLPQIVRLIENGEKEVIGADLQGGLIFHTAVSVAGIGPTSSNKEEIESSMIPLSRAGIKIHLGKGKISRKTVEGLDKYHSVYAIIPPITALLEEHVLSREVLCFPEYGMEAFYRLAVENLPVIIAASEGRCLYD